MPSKSAPSTGFTSVSSTSVKGGGRAKLSDENASSIIDLLRSLRDPKDPLRPKQRKRNRPADANDTSDDINNIEEEKELYDHGLKRERKRFVKRLVERHERVALARKINGPDALASTSGISSVSVESTPTGTSAVSTNLQSLTFDADDAAQIVGGATGKVRIVLVEAIYSIGGKKKSKDEKGKSKDKKKRDKKDESSKKKKKDKSSRPWKEGQIRKTLALPRSTSAKEMLKEAKSKLNMKKKPVRCFYVDGKTKLEVDLVSNLAGLGDGAVVYATSHVETAGEGKQSDKDEENTADVVAADETTIDIPDPLEPVKRAYAERKMRKARRMGRRNNQDSGPSRRTIGDPPTFADHLDKLETLPPSRAELPAASYRTKVLTALDTSRVVVICGATGCGKSTQIPQMILEGMTAAGRMDDTHVIVTQPRRVAAMSLAERVASERNSPPPGANGSFVGYNVRLSRRVSDDAKIVYCTVGILLRMLVNPSEVMEDDLCPTSRADCDSEEASGQDGQTKTAVPLSSVTHVLIDEVHERDLSTDFALTLLRPLLANNSRIRVLLMSATASPDLFVNYFRSSALAIDPIVLSIPGRTFPVSNNWLTDCEKFAGARLQGWSNAIEENPRLGGASAENVDETDVELSPRAMSRIDNTFICKLIAAIIRKQREEGKLDRSKAKNLREDGAILVFLPGKGEIESLARALRDDPFVGDNNICNVLKLHSTVPQSQQRLVFQRAKVGTVKIILSTNVAETSITIPDVSSVIDTGRVKESRFNSSTRIKELVTVWTSRASATQRAGRAGRTGPGVCWKLYTEQFYNEHLPMRTSPEIVRTPLDELILQCCLLEENTTRRDASKSTTGFAGTMPIKFLRQAPEPPPTKSLLHACEHLLEVGGIEFVANEPEYVFKLTPLGYHLSHLPMDSKVAKCLIIGCILECVGPSLTIAACLSHSKSIWLPSRAIDKNARDMQKKLVEEGFGGKDWRGGTVKGDLIGNIAAYNAWSAHQKEKDRRKIASKYALDHHVLREVHSLRSQFKDSLVDAGFLESRSGCDGSHDDALFCMCCLVAGLHPNVATLMRPRPGRGNLRGGRLITKDGDICKASSSSFQSDRLWNAGEKGEDRYAVFHAKHRTIGVDTKSIGGGQADIYLNEITFVSRFALLLFAGNIELRDNAIILDGWLKFKVGEKGGKTGAILIIELRKELDNVMTRHIMSGDEVDEEADSNCQRVLMVVRKLLQDEADKVI